jgi:anti-anti-sigma factor
VEAAVEMLDIHLEEGPPPVLHVAGELDIATGDQLRAALVHALSASPTVVLDLSGVTFVDVAGLRAILETAESLNGHGPLAVANAPLVTRLLELVGLAGTPSLAIRDED